MVNEGKGSQVKNTLTQDEIDAELFGGGSKKKDDNATEEMVTPEREKATRRNPFDLRAQKYYSQEYRALQAEGPASERAPQGRGLE